MRGKIVDALNERGRGSVWVQLFVELEMNMPQGRALCIIANLSQQWY